MLPKFELHTPATINEACTLKRELGPDAEITAGGTDVYAKMHNGDLRPANIIDLKQIPELYGITAETGKGLILGALATHHEIETSDIIRCRYSVLAEAVSTIGSLQVRNRGTIGGNICTAAPSADGIGPLLIFNADCTVRGTGGERSVPLIKFFVGPKRTILKDDEILVNVVIPEPAENYGAAFFKYGRRDAMEIALLGVTVYIITEGDGETCSEARIALATSAPTPIRAEATEAFLKGKDLSDDRILAESGRKVLEEAKPRSSWRSSEEFRRDLLERLVPRTIREAFKRIEKGDGNERL